MNKLNMVSREHYYDNVLATTAYQTVTDATTIANDSIAYSSTLKALRINDSSASTKIMLGIPVGKLQPGDRVKVSFERMNVSGDAVRVTLDLYDSAFYTGAFTSIAPVITPKTSYFDSFEQTFTVTAEKYVAVALGVFTTGVGDNYIRNVVIEVESQGVVKFIKPYQSLINFDSRVGTIDYTQDCFYIVDGDMCRVFFNFDVTGFAVTQGFATHIKLPLLPQRSIIAGNAYVYNTADSVNVMEPLTLTANSLFAYLKTPNVISTKFKVGTKLYGVVEYPI